MMYYLGQSWGAGKAKDHRDHTIGRQVMRVRLSSERDAIVLDLDNGDTLGAAVEADCCSQTEICHLSGVSVLLRYPITGFSDDDLPNPADRPEAEWPQEAERLYGLTVKTAGGVFTIDYRNYSNGYYGGSLGLLHANGMQGKWRVVAEDE
jgi:hypothetical protein